MLISGIVTVGAFLLIALGATRQNRSALYTLGGFVLMIGSIYLHSQAYSSLIPAAAAISAEIGIGFWLMAGLLSKHRKNARPFFYFGSISMVTAVVLFAGIRFVGSQTITTFLLELGPDDSISELESTLNRFNASTEKAFPTLSLRDDENLAQVFIVSVLDRNIEALMRDLRADEENVDHVELNFEVSLSEPSSSSDGYDSPGKILENDPLARSQWALDAIHGHEAHAILRGLSPVRKARVAILDTGVDASHEDVSGVFSSSPAIRDLHGHGSHCAGVAGANTNNAVGIASLNWDGDFIDILAYRALNQSGTGTIEMISQAIIDATADRADVISLSLGTKARTPKVIQDAIAFALKRDVIVVVSAGNSNEDARDHMPSAVKGVIVVSALDENLDKASFSNTNTSLSRPIAAPGVNILSLKTGGGYVQMSGTSMSTPLVSGLIGIMRALDPDISDSEVYSILEGTGKSVKDTRRIGKLIDAEKAIKAVLSGL